MLPADRKASGKHACFDCGESGHWAGDAKCKKPGAGLFKTPKGKGKGKGKRPERHVKIAEHDNQITEYETDVVEAQGAWPAEASCLDAVSLSSALSASGAGSSSDGRVSGEVYKVSQSVVDEIICVHSQSLNQAINRNHDSRSDSTTVSPPPFNGQECLTALGKEKPEQHPLGKERPGQHPLGKEKPGQHPLGTEKQQTTLGNGKKETISPEKYGTGALDSACNRSCSGPVVIDHYRRQLVGTPVEHLIKVVKECERFKFGDSGILHSIARIRLPVFVCDTVLLV